MPRLPVVINEAYLRISSQCTLDEIVSSEEIAVFKKADILIHVNPLH